MSKTSVGLDLLESLEILSHFSIEGVGSKLVVFAISEIVDSVEKPWRDSVGNRIGNDLGDLAALLFSEETSSSSGIDFQNLANDVGESSADTSDTGESDGGDSLSVDVGVQNTMDVFEVSFLFNNETH